jgi:outer membrane protein OmpA-like peptidoglycan-associated protein
MRIFCFLLFNFACFISYTQQTIRNTVYFDFDSNEPTALSKTELSLFIKQVKDLPVNSVSVYGYADKKGTRLYNKELSADRAGFILQFLKNTLTGNIVYNNYSFGG